MSDWLRPVGSFLSFISAVLLTQLSALHCAEVGRVCVRVCLYSNLLCQSSTELHPAVATSLLVAAGVFRWPFTSWERAWGSVFNFLLSRLSPDRKLHPKTARGLICRAPSKVPDVWVRIVPGRNGAPLKKCFSLMSALHIWCHMSQTSQGFYSSHPQLVTVHLWL